jgi:2-methylcitrate dehydratase PrpD
MIQAASLLANATRDLEKFAAGLRFGNMPAQVVDHAKLCILDGHGVALFGAGLPSIGHVRALARAEGVTPAASFRGTPYRGSIAQAALVNGTASDAFEMDDIRKEAILHPNALACPVALGFAEAAGGMSGRDVLTAIVAGYEVGTRVGNAVTMALFLRGFQPQGTSGAFVAAATAGRIIGLPAEQMQHAFGIAGSMGAGPGSVWETAEVGFKLYPGGATAVQMNQFYDLAVIALHRDASVRQYDEMRLAGPAVLRFIEWISAFEDQGLEAMGAPFRYERLARRGSPEDAVGETGIVRKFEANVRAILSGDDAGSLCEQVMRLDTLDDTRALATRLSVEPAGGA